MLLQCSKMLETRETEAGNSCVLGNMRGSQSPPFISVFMVVLGAKNLKISGKD